MENKSRSIKDWAVNDRPREKMLSHGHRTLSDSELLAIIMGSGSRHQSAVDLAKEILNSVNNNWNDLARLGVKDLCKFKGIGPAKAISIITALEIGRRRASQEIPERPKISRGIDTYNILKGVIGDLNHEEFWVLYLNQQNRVIRKEKIGSGGISSTIADVRIIMKIALEEMATGLVLAHNHPSGNLKPSRPDKALTKNILDAGHILNIDVMDHVIITQGGYYSFAEEGDL